MIGIAAVYAAVPGLREEELRAWLAEEWVRPVMRDGELAFGAVDVARIRLILDLHRDMAVEPPTVPLVLQLLDQLFATRRQLRRVLELAEPPLRERLVEVLVQE